MNYSPFVTRLLMQIANNEAMMHHQYRAAIAHAPDEEMKQIYIENARAHARTTNFFASLIEKRLTPDATA